MKQCNDDVNDCGVGVHMMSEPIQLICGLVNTFASGYDMILPADIADELLSLPLFAIISLTGNRTT